MKEPGSCQPPTTSSSSSSDDQLIMFCFHLACIHHHHSSFPHKPSLELTWPSNDWWTKMSPVLASILKYLDPSLNLAASRLYVMISLSVSIVWTVTTRLPARRGQRRGREEGNMSSIRQSIQGDSSTRLTHWLLLRNINITLEIEHWRTVVAIHGLSNCDHTHTGGE